MSATMSKRKMKFYVLENKILEWLKDLKEVFETISEEELPSSRIEIDHEIILKIETIKPSSFILTRSEEEIVKKYLNEMIKKKWIRVNKSLMTTYLFLILKSETDQKRPVIDYRKLNEEIVTDSTPLLLIRDIMNQIKEQQYFIKINLKNVFNQIRIKEEDEWKTTFQIRYEIFKYLIMFFGLINVLTTF